MKNKSKIIVKALEELRVKRGWDRKRMGEALGIGYSHYLEVVYGKRTLSLGGTKRAFKLGVPAKYLLC